MLINNINNKRLIEKENIKKHLELKCVCDNSKDTNKNADIMDAEICSERYVN